jgi:hypothetical protein
MDMSSLQNDLPKGKPSPPPPSLPPAPLTSDFKAAALAVTKLYQNSARQIDLARQEGYLSAVQEVASLLSQGELAGDRLREWCAVGLSRITAQQDEENRTRPTHQRGNNTDNTQIDEDSSPRREPPATTEMTPIASSPIMSNRMQLPLQNPFGNTEFNFQSSPLPIVSMGLSGYSSPFGERVEPEVTYEVVENGREGNGRKRTVNQFGSIWDVSGNGGNKRSRHM